MHEREHARSRAGSSSTLDGEVAPGRGSRSSQLDAPARPLVSGLIQRKATRDGDGVEANADNALAAASESSGAPLPTPILRKFESSVGADLSSVRIHTGDASATAAAAVSARAYTVGQDIHFAAGQYDPSSAAGEHLLAHEVAHTVQQRGGAPVQQNKLAVSSPADAAEHEADRAADAMVGGATAVIASAPALTSRMVMRDADALKEREKYKGPAPDHPFQRLAAQDRVQIEQLAIDQLRLLTATTIDQAYANFLAACLEAIDTLKSQQKAEAEQREAAINFAFGAVGMLLGPVGKALVGAAPGLTLQSDLVDALSLRIPPVVANNVIIPGMSVRTDAAAFLASDAVTYLAEKFTPETAENAIEGVAGKVAGVAKGVRGASPHQMAINFVYAMEEAAHPSSLQLRASVAVSTDPAALMGIHARFAAATPAVYRAEVNTKAQHFLEQVGRSQAGAHGVGIMNAYGRDRLFTYSIVTDDLLSGTAYYFESWVTPDMESAVVALNPEPKRMDPGRIRGRIPEPTLEAAHGKAGGEVIVRMNAYAQTGLAAVEADVKMGGNTAYKFVRWIPQDEEAEAIASGQQQLAGIPDFDPGRIEGHIPEPPKRS